MSYKLTSLSSLLTLLDHSLLISLGSRSLTKLTVPVFDISFSIPSNDKSLYPHSIISTKSINLVHEPNINILCKVSSGEPVMLTKRIILSLINGIYDPIGFLGPIIVRAKIHMKQLWNKGELDCLISILNNDHLCAVSQLQLN